MDTVKQQGERLKLKGELFIKQNIKAFIKTIYDDYYFCDILSIGEDFILISNFKGKRIGIKERIPWIDIIEIKEYKKEGDL